MTKWKSKKLGELCEFGNGLWTGKKPPFQKVGVIRNTNFTKDGKLDDTDIVYLDVEQAQFAKRKLHYGDIIIEKSGGGPKQPVGRVVIFDKTDGDFSFSNFTSVIRIKNKNEADFNYLHRYLYFEYVSGATEKMQSHSTGIRNLKFDDYKEIEIPLPPLPEQLRIVSILDECFAAIDKAKANAEQNLKNAKELFESYLQGVFEKNSKVHHKKSIGEVCDLIDSLHKTPKYIKVGGYPMVRVTEIKKGILDTSSALRVDEETYREFSKKHIPKSGDIVFSRVGASFGVSSIVVSDEPFCLGQNTVFIIPKIDSYYCYYFLNSQEARDQMNKLVAGAAQPTISLKSIKELTVAIPSPKEQKTIVSQLDALRAKTQKLEAVYQKKLANLEELKKSILEKAFAGELKTEKVLAV
ncbi:MAG: restriction endonuclease subunit S [Bacteroidia bacterium]|jgi:type I restriction enzyme S subunit|nr:restriction endonuclease subunit S [Bacteroidia bacterium]